MPSKLCPQCGTEYDLSQQFCPTDGAALLAPASDADFTGQIFGGRYRLLKKLGAGGMGSVYLAEHVRLKKPAAVKVIRKSMTADPAAIARFNREAQNASMVNHPNVAAVYDFGEADGGVVFLAMEYVEGEPLSAIIRRGPLPPAQASRLVSQIADALTAAHRMGVVHRDLKPDNVMVALGPDGSDVVKLVDFGISKVSNVDDQHITATGMVIGTPTYMSPEQAKGTALDSRSDIYSLGVLTFQTLTAVLPFKGDTPQEQLVSRLVESPARLSAVRPDIAWAPAVEQVLSTAMAAKPEERYATAQDFARALDAALRAGRRSAGQTPTIALAAVSSELASAAAKASTTPQPVAAPTPGRWGVVIGAAVAAGVVVAVAGVVFLKQLPSFRQPAAAGQVAASSLPANVGAVSSPRVEPQGKAAPQEIPTTQTQSPVHSESQSAAKTESEAPANTERQAPTHAESEPPRHAETQPPPARVTDSVDSSEPATPPVTLRAAIQNLGAEVRGPGGTPAQYRVAYAQSVVLLNHAITVPDSVRILFYQSRALALLGDRSAACQSLSQAMRLAGDAPAARGLDRLSVRMRCY